MSFSKHYGKFKKHKREKGLFYAFGRGMKYLFYRLRTAGVDRFPVSGELSRGDLRIFYGDGNVHFFWKSDPLTKWPGLSSAVHSWGLWTDTSKAKWQFIQETSDSVKIRISFKELPVHQTWFLKLESERCIHWSVDLEVDEPLYIDEFRFLSLLRHGYKTWVSGYTQGNFPRLDHVWHDLWIKEQPVDLVAARFSLRDEILPAYSMEIIEGPGDFSAIVQGPPSDLSSHFIGFRTLEKKSSREYAPGRYPLLSARITLSDENLLDSKIEDLRRKDFKRIFAEDAKGSSLRRDGARFSEDILLIQCPPWDPQMPPLSVATLSSFLERSGHSVAVSDLNIALYNSVPFGAKYLWEQGGYDHWVEEKLFPKTWSSLKDASFLFLDEALKGRSVRSIGLSVNYAGIPFASEALRFIKELDQDLFIIVGGWGSISESLRRMFPVDLVDVFVVGEGEETLKEVLEALKGQRQLKDIEGIVSYKKDIAYKPRPPIMDLDALPWPTFKEFDLRQYKSPTIPLLASRGCVGHCVFCNDWFYSKPYRARSAKNILEEIRYHIEDKKVDGFSFKDLACNGDFKKLESLCDLIIGAGLAIQWDSHAIPLTGMSRELLRKMKKAGCVSLFYGVESFSNNVLKRMEKAFTREIAGQVLRDTAQAGIRAAINIIVGFPGETQADFQETLEGIQRNRRYISHVCSVSPCLVNPDSALEHHSQEYGLVTSGEKSAFTRRWASTQDENSYALRCFRAGQVLDLLQRLSIRCNYSAVEEAEIRTR